MFKSDTVVQRSITDAVTGASFPVVFSPNSINIGGLTLNPNDLRAMLKAYDDEHPPAGKLVPRVESERIAKGWPTR